MPLTLLLFSSFLLLTVLLILAANFSALETALFTLRERNLAQEEDLPRSQKSKKLLLDTANTLEESMLLGSISNLALAATALYTILHPLRDIGFSPWATTPIVLIASIVIVEIVPRACALRSPTYTARCTLPLLRVCRRLVLPITKPLLFLGHWLARTLTPAKSRFTNPLSPEELPTFIDMRTEQGSISKIDSDMMHSIVTLQKLAVRDLMTPRVDLPLMPHDAEEEEAYSMLNLARHPYVAVYDPKQDGVTELIDVQRWKLCGRSSWQAASKPPVFVQETLPLIRVWKDCLQDPNSVVVIVDEFGGFQGLLTHQDVVNYLLAKSAPALGTQANIQYIGSNRYLIAGQTRLEEIEQELDINFNNDEVDTISGLIIAHHNGVVPKPGQRIHFSDFDIKVKRTARLRVQQLEIIIHSPTASDE